LRSARRNENGPWRRRHGWRARLARRNARAGTRGRRERAGAVVRSTGALSAEAGEVW